MVRVVNGPARAMDKGDGMDAAAHTLAGYRGAATLLWGSWRIAGLASIDVASPGAPLGTFTVDSEGEPLLLSALAGALQEPYVLRLGTELEQDVPIDITFLGHDGNRISFSIREHRTGSSS